MSQAVPSYPIPCMHYKHRRTLPPQPLLPAFSTKTALQTATTTSTSDTTGAALATLLQGVQVLAESILFVQVVNPLPNRTIYFKPSLELPLCVSSSPIVASGPVVWIALHNHRAEPLTLNADHQVGTIEAAEVVGPKETAASASPSNLDKLVHSQLTQLL